MSAQETSTKKVADLTETISSSLTNLITELIRASPPQAPPPTSPDNNINKEILRELQSLSAKVGSIYSDLHSVKAHTDCEREAAQKKLIDGTNLLDLLDLSNTGGSGNHIIPVEKNNEIARRYNSELLHSNDLLAPLLNTRGNRAFGFPTTVSDLLNLDSTTEKLLCGAFGLKYQSESNIFIKFCGFDPDVFFDLDLPEICGRELTGTRVFNRHKRAIDLEAAGEPTASTRKAAAQHNAEARRHNALAGGSEYFEIRPIHDERFLVVPGFPTRYYWFSSPHQRDVLYLLREYGQDVEPEGCLQRFLAFVGIPMDLIQEEGPESQMEWLS